MNHHYAELGDVWKHLPLAEILRMHPPRHYWETHAGSASYPLTGSPSRLHGALRLLSRSPGDPDLRDSAYLTALHATPGVYPGSPGLAVRLLGAAASYLLCDLDPDSVASLKEATRDVPARVIEGDGVAAVYDEAGRAPAAPEDVLVLIDPFDPFERRTPGKPTPVELAARLARGGYRLVYWYGYESGAERGWAGEAIARAAPHAALWCGDVLMPASLVYPDRSGAWGCGVVLANATTAEVRACERLGRALERIGEDDQVQGNDPPRLTFRTIA